MTLALVCILLTVFAVVLVALNEGERPHRPHRASDPSGKEHR